MKNLKYMLLITMIMLSFTACGNSSIKQDTGNTMNETENIEDTNDIENADVESTSNSIGTTIKLDFIELLNDNQEQTPQEIADKLLENPALDFGGATMQVEPGLLTGFDNAEIIGFSDGVMFAPMIGSIPFVGYVFQLESESDVDSFIQTLSKNANPRWNICTEADETIIESVGNYVLFVMSPTTLE